METHVACFNATGSSFIPGTCAQCRHRKVKCDKRPGNCANCERLGLDCSFASTSIALSVPRRLRGVRACATCRESKIKCSGTTPRCSNCKRRGRTCVYPTPKRPTLDLVSSTSPVEEDEEAGTVTILEGMLSLVDIFFEKIYPMPSFAFLHPASTKRRCRDGAQNKVLVLAISAMTSLYTSQNLEEASIWIEESEQYIWQHIESPTIPRLQALLLIIHYRMETSRFQRAFMLIAIAARSAAAMRLNHERQDLDPIAKEVRRRIVWSLKITERYFSVGLPEFELCPFESIYLQLPSSEEEFSGVDQPGDHGSYSLHVRLENVRRDIMKLTRAITLCEQPYPLLPKLLRDFRQGLAEVGSVMLDGTELSPHQIAELLGNPWLPRRVLAIVSWHQCHCDLYRILLNGYPEAAPAVVLRAIGSDDITAAERCCLKHSMSIVDILTNLNQQSTDCHLLEFDVAICAYHAARLLLFISRFGTIRDRPSPEFATSRVDLCLIALKRFYGSSVLVRPIIEEMERSVKTFSQQGHSSVSPPSNANAEPSGDSEDQLSSVAKTRQRLAIHSLLRQADFSDGEENDRETETARQKSLKDSETSFDEQVSSDKDKHLSTQTKSLAMQDREPLPSEYNIEDYSGNSSNQAAQFYGDSAPSPSMSDQTESLQFPFSLWFGQYDNDWLQNPFP
ncbi:uncharacterized protein GGS22DRAFT_50631 [Annulohypoxylon maeteangense]|uniref:uncharacterized protein n=1 Tax=Annulohypoxylon maeteangense TaxID=1927788 RepID=UPI002007F2DA|nr:uncharacterized protein GGS22DRAFT_50631 [Annulohypoxylon maeteangense]KAI0882349.1 hypothetical protein GGS22DRAFT_50631 [Annulohypoxylon maeteangense]